MPLCRQLREFERDSYASGPVSRVLECGEPATETVAIKGDLHDMCSRCAGEAVELFSAIRVAKGRENDAARLREISGHLARWAQDFAQRPGISAWFVECATILDGLATDVLEGRA
jgi:hypothetical protein